MGFLANPVLARELRSRIRGTRALIILVIYLVITGLVTYFVYAASAGSFFDPTTNAEAGRGIGKAIFLTVMIASLIQICVITPSLTAGAIVSEKERQSYDLLITTLLSPLQIILGKLTSALSFALLLIIAALPMAGLAFLFGGVSGIEMLIGVIGLAATAVCYATIGIFWSTVMRSSLAATVMAQGTVIFMLLFVPFLFVVGGITSGFFDDSPGVIGTYAFGLLLCFHPFIALGITATSLASGENPFYFSIPGANGDIWVPSPWIVYLFITLLLTLLFLTLSVRLLKPVQYDVPLKKKQREE